MSSVVLLGDTSGSVTLAVPTVAGSNTVTIPAGTGTAAVQGVSTNIVSGTSVTCAGQTAIDFTGIPSWVKRITVMFNGVSTSGTANPIIQIGTSGGVQNTGYLSSASYAKTSTVLSVNGTTGFPLTASTLAADLRHGSYVLTLLDSATGTWTFFGVTGTSNDTQTGWAGGSKALSGTLDRVRITTTGADTFDTTPSAGTINILYE